MITSNVISRVLKIRVAGAEASMVVIDVDDKQYGVTAKHVFQEQSPGYGWVDKWHEGQPVEIWQGDNYKRSKPTLIGHANGYCDISVLSFSNLLASPGLTLSASEDQIIYGQSVYFLGFPFGLHTPYGDSNNSFPLPFVKKAILAGTHDGNGSLFYLDGINNAGFSGGPVVFRPENNKPFQLMAIVSGYRFSQSRVMVNGEETEQYVQENTGLIRAWGIHAAIEVIKNNPLGYNLPSESV